MVPETVKANIERVLVENKEEVVKKLKNLFEYPLHPDTRILLFEVQGDSGIFGIQISQFKYLDEEIQYNAKGEFIGSAIVDFGFDFFEYIPRYVYKQDIDTEIEFSKYAEERMYEWLADCFEEAGGKKFPIKCCVHFHDTGEGFDLHDRQWKDLEDFENH
ncbi:hypothetical protein GCM10011571_16950 [Marinithermofilum abyssi]|uniref:DUF600 family protein n=1 Tax=Marinithermofilum abyssi TaxID=1571185 RepID=A0A8J2YAL6_9BACL|nr:hypothetical protein [Marinithermofilum abyssi]GGE15945.1 hypothetical protein GCM10011571_16950 [Marinithermofilum abyssi]